MRTDILHGSIWGSLLKFSFPIIASSLVQTATGFVNLFWVGQYLNSENVAAVTIGNTLFLLLMSLLVGFVAAATIKIGTQIGAKDYKQAAVTFGTGLAFCGTIAIIVAAVALNWSALIIGWFGVNDTTSVHAGEYFRMLAYIVPIVGAYSYCVSVSRAAGDSTTPFYVIFSGFLLDAFLTPLLIAGFWFIPAFDVGGAAIASGVANFVALLWMFKCITRFEFFPWFSVKAANTQQIGSTVKYLLTKGSAIGTQYIALAVSSYLFLLLLSSQGSDLVAAFGVNQQIWNLVQLPCAALGTASSAMVAQMMGAKRHSDIQIVALVGITYSVVITAAVCTAVLLFQAPLVALFLSPNSSAFSDALHILRAVLWSYVFYAVSIVFFGVARGAGWVVYPMIAVCVSLILVRLGMAYFLVPFMGVSGFWLAMNSGMIVSALLGGVIFFRLVSASEAQFVLECRNSD